jgi:nucleoid-associated protein YgaU
MFLENSRYFKVPTVESATDDGRAVTALKLRPLPVPSSVTHVVKDNDQLDVLAHQHYSDGTKFWHIADANTALQASELVSETGATILRPKA